MRTGSSRRSWVGTTLWLTVFVAACAVGRAGVVPALGIALVWPASGVGLLWLSHRRRRDWPLTLALMAVSVGTVTAVAGSPPGAVALSVLTVVPPAVAVLLLRRWQPRLWSARSRARLGRVGQFGALLAAVSVGSLVYAVVRTGLGMLLVPGEEWTLGLGRFGAVAAPMVAVGAAGRLVSDWVRRARAEDQPMVRARTRGDLLHLVGVAAATVLIFVLGFGQTPEVPSTFVLTLPVVWGALRFPPVVVGLHGLVNGVVATVMTTVGLGPIANISELVLRAIITQMFVAALMVIGLTVALTRAQLSESIGRLRASEAELARRNQELGLVVDHLRDGIAVVQEGGRYLQANDALRRIFTGFSGGDAFTGAVPPPSDYHLFHPDGRPVEVHELPYLRALAGHAVDHEEFHLRKPAAPGHQVIEISAYAMPPDPDQPARAMVTVRDVTAEKAHRDALTAFAGTVAHDLYNPLTVVDGWAEALEDRLAEVDAVPVPEAQTMVRHVRAGVEQMHAFIADLLAHSTSRDRVLQGEQVDLLQLAERVARSRVGPTGRGVVELGELGEVHGDRLLIQQVIDNLVGNALKYVAHDVTPRVRVDAEPVGDGWTCVSVSDNGIGIRPADRERVFESFHRVDRSYQGTGLGLAICKNTVERHGGRISVRDSAHGGSCFELVLPTDRETFLRATGSAGTIRGAGRAESPA